MKSKIQEVLGFIGFVVLVLEIPLGSILYVAKRIEYVSGSASIEQLRSDLTTVTAQRSEDAVGQATQWNQTIATMKRWNAVPFVCLFIPDGWDRIKPIQIPE